MVDECPHCYARVLAKADGECPACHKNIFDLTGTDPDRVSLLVLHGQTFPSFCCDCGVATDRRVRVKSIVGGPGGGASPASWLGMILAALGSIMGLILYVAAKREERSRRPNDVAIVEMPQCDSCGKRRRPAAIRIDTEALRMTFVVHRDFKARVEAT